MVSTGMKRYRQRSVDQAAYVGCDKGPIDPQALFGRSAPLRLDVGFGHGSFLAALAASHPDEDFIGIEQNPLRVTKTAHKCAGLGLANIRLYEGNAHAFIRDRLPPDSLSRCYVLFSDPWPKAKHRRRRLINRSFLVDLAWAMAPGGRLVVASDTHNYALGVLTHTTTMSGIWRNRYAPQGYRFNVHTRFPTVFERHKKAEGCKICYLCCERTGTPAPARVTGPPPDPDRS